MTARYEEAEQVGATALDECYGPNDENLTWLGRALTWQDERKLARAVLDALLSSGLLPKLAIEAGQLEQVGYVSAGHNFYTLPKQFSVKARRVFVLREPEEPT